MFLMLLRKYSDVEKVEKITHQHLHYHGFFTHVLPRQTFQKNLFYQIIPTLAH